MLILSVLFLFHFFIGQLLDISKSKVAYYFFTSILLFAVFYFTLGITDNADNYMFKYFYENDWDKIDPMFIFLTKVMNYFKFNYFDFYKLHIIIYTLSYFFFISRYTKNIFYVFLVFFVLYYVPYVNQIRYYLAFPFFLLSIHYFIQKRNLFLFILFTFLAVTSHSAITLLYSFIPMYYFFSTKSFFKVTFLASGVAFLIVMVLFQLGIAQEIEHFGEYFTKGMTSSVAGGMFNALPYFIYIIYLWLIDRRYRKNNPDYINDKTYSLLSKFSFFSIIFIPASFFVQVLGHRYVFPFLIVWMIFFLYIIRNESPKRKFFSFLIAGIVHLIVGFSIYILPLYIFGESSFEEELIKSTKSIQYIDFLDLFRN